MKNINKLFTIQSTIILIIMIVVIMYSLQTEINVVGPAHAQVITNVKNQPQRSFTQTIREVTAFNAGDTSQTDNNPCIGASGENICEALSRGEKVCAANFVPIGTKLNVDGYGECIVMDKMNKRYRNRVDIAFKKNEKQRAINFGIQNLNVKTYK